LLKRKFPNLNRPYKSPVGVGGALIAGILALVIFIGQALNEGYRSAIIAIAIVYAVGLLLFALFGRKRLVLSPEEQAAIKGHN
jgi:ethanolamine permease